MKLRDAMKKKAAEYKMQELESKAQLHKMTKKRLIEIAKKHGVIIALDDELKDEVEKIKKDYNINESNVIRELINEDDVLSRKKKIDHEKLGMLSYQRVMMEKDETGGLFLLTDLYDLINTGSLKGRVTLEDLEKAIGILEKKKVIPEIKELDSGVIMVSYFPVEYTSDQSEVLKFAGENEGSCSLSETCTGLNWSDDRALRALENLEATGIAKTDESFRTGKRWYFPNLGKK
ncbi:MAG: hypothetical protein ACTSWY_12595 [Promethearchaeota archaeon]